MKRSILISGVIFQSLCSAQMFAQDTTKTSTTTTTTITTDTTKVNNTVAPVPPPAPAPAPVPVIAPAPEEKAEADVPGGYFGLRYMPTFTSFDVKTSDNGVAKTSFTLGHGAGVFIGGNFNRHSAMQLEVIYSQLAQKYVLNKRESEVDLNYVNIPLMFVLNTNITAPVNFNITAGPQVGINVGSSINSGTNNYGNDSTTAVLAVKAGDFGVAYGAGFDFHLGSDVLLGIGFRGVYGLLDISDKSKTRATNEYLILDRAKVNTYAGYIGLRFNF